MTNSKLTATVEAYFADLRRVRASGGGTGERSSYAPLANLLNALGAALSPKVFCVAELADQGAGHPDFGLYAARQVQKGRPRPGQAPERGVVEVKPPQEDLQDLIASGQARRYLARYGLVLATNLRAFALVGPGASGGAALETFRLADSAEDFDRRLEKPKSFAREVGPGLGEYLGRALSHRAEIAEPKDLAWLLASYARDGLSRVQAGGDSPALASVRGALEEALGVRFEGKRGARFFQSTLVQTLFYGVFSAWVLWSRQAPPPAGPFNWREAVWHLRAPVLRALFQQLSDPGRLQSLGLVEVLDWTSAALDRVNRNAFFARFDEGEAVPYFYEPFLQAFDPRLRKQLGVWYTPSEVVRYMVARVDLALKQDLGIADGLAADNVYVLDPCCGTGAYLAEVLRRIAANLQGRGLGALAGARVKQAALRRVFGFEIMPAPFAVAHLQVGLTLQALDAPLAEGAAGQTDEERPGVFLTNALTGWEPKANKPLPFPELEDERDRAERVKREAPILVILGNPPYNGFAGMAVDEERALSDAYRTTKQARRPEGQGLNDLYVRFFRMAERRIAEKTGQGVVCFISNYSWLDGLSFTGMRERYLEAFDAVRIDCLNGDKYKTGKVAPDGLPDPSIFSTESDPVGIQVGTAIATLVRKADHGPAAHIGFRHLWGQAKREELLETAEAQPDAIYERLDPNLPLGLPFARTAVSHAWFDWPALPDLFPASFPGVKTSRDGFLVDVDLDRLKARMADYFNPSLSHEEIARRYPSAMRSTARFNARAVREALLARGGPSEDGFVRYAYRPFDNRWLYWEADTKLLDEKRSEYRPHVFERNLWFSAAQQIRKGESEPQTCFVKYMGSLHAIERGTNWFPAYLRTGTIELEDNATQSQPNPKAEIHQEHGPHEGGDDATQRQSSLNAESPQENAPHGSADLGEPEADAAAAENPQAEGLRNIGYSAAHRQPDPNAASPQEQWPQQSNDDGVQRQPNLSSAARKYLEYLGMTVEDLFHHILATLHDPAYRQANAGALRMEWPRIPLPGRPAPGTLGVPPAKDQMSEAEDPPPSKAGVSLASTPSALPPTPTDETPALPRGTPAHEGLESAEERAFPGSGASEDAGVPLADEPDFNTKEPRTAPSRQVGRREAAAALAQSAARGRTLAALLDPDTPVPGVTQAPLRPEFAAIAVPATTDGRNMAGDDFALTAGWGHFGTGGAVMPGQGRAEQRPYTGEEQAALNAAAVPAQHPDAPFNPSTKPTAHAAAPQASAAASAGTLAQAAAAAIPSTFDIHLNDRAYWRNVPAAVWHYKLGGYQVLKKWLSYRERSILNRPLLPEEVQHFTDTARRIAAILLC